MKKTNGKYVLIFFLAAWIVLVVSIYVYESRSENTISILTESKKPSKTRAYSDEELRDLARKSDNNQTDTLNNGSLEEALFIFNENDIIINSQTGIDIVDGTEDNSVETSLPILDTTYFRDENFNRISQLNNQTGEEKKCGDFPCYTSQEFLDLYDTFEINQNLDFLDKYIYQINDVDDYIKNKAIERGYRKRGFAREEDLILFESHQTRLDVRDSYVALRNEMLAEGIGLHFVSGYRSSTSQRSIFKNKMNLQSTVGIVEGEYDTKLDEVLSRSAIPGYSKHHSGYAVDFGCGNDYLVFSFAETECYQWMSANNFEKAKKHGFIPSYPEGIDSQGPNPEPWEFVWVGVENI